MKNQFSKEIWDLWPSRFRAQFFNSLGGIKTAGLLSTFNTNGKANSAVFSQIIHIGSSPPTWGFLFRPPTKGHQTYDNILRNPYFNFCLATSFISAKELHQTSANYNENVSELDSLNIKWKNHRKYHVPLLLNGDFQLIFRHTKSHTMSNQTVLLEAEIIHVSSSLDPDDNGFIDLTQKVLLSSQGTSAYSKADKVEKFPYAKT
tara:strand:- start:4075 stop:4686 length:612 start_codon:yes stop_codon:yes gene_type:complete